jgi:hypothetical protein
MDLNKLYFRAARCVCPETAKPLNVNLCPALAQFEVCSSLYPCPTEDYTVRSLFDGRAWRDG